MKLIVVFVIALALGNIQADESITEIVSTPFGLRPRQCVNEWPSGTVVTDIAEERAVEVTLPNGKTHVIPADEVCLAAQARWLETRSSGRNNTKRLNWQDGVLDNAEYLSSPGYYVQKVSGEWSVPPDPEYQSSGHGNQVTPSFYYYIAVENESSDSAGPTTLQSTLAWQYSEWSLSSWNCCPQGQTHYSSKILGMQKGSTVSGTIDETSPVVDGSWTITSTFGKSESTLKVGSLERRFNMARCSLEVYDVTECAMLSDGMVDFSRLSVTTTEHVVSRAKPSPSPYNEWQATTGATECSGSTTIKGSAVDISHHY